MDPVTHTLVNTATYSVIHQDKLSMDDPLLLAVIVGGLLPDIDSVMQLFGDLPYLKYHRGPTHSILGMVVLSFLTANVLGFIIGGDLIYLFSFTLLGSFCHTILDILNSYGAKLFWPFYKKKVTLNLLVLLEPILIMLTLGVILLHQFSYPSLALLCYTAIIFYSLFRYSSRKKLQCFLRNEFQTFNPEQITILPNLMSSLRWNFIIDTGQYLFIGQAPLFIKAYQITQKIKKETENLFIKKALSSKIGVIFQEFTPLFCINYYQKGKYHIIKFIDLRYHVKNGFMHNGFVKYTKHGEISEAVFQPYHPNRKIYLK